MARWPWSRTKVEDYGGSQARVEAEEHLRHHQEQRVEVSQISQSLKGLRVRNHFSEQIAGLIEGKSHR